MKINGIKLETIYKIIEDYNDRLYRIGDNFLSFYFVPGANTWSVEIEIDRSITEEEFMYSLSDLEETRGNCLEPSEEEAEQELRKLIDSRIIELGTLKEIL